MRRIVLPMSLNSVCFGALGSFASEFEFGLFRRADCCVSGFEFAFLTRE
jgi:hypothetical protein